jgi:hypothetical protein
MTPPGAFMMEDQPGFFEIEDHDDMNTASIGVLAGKDEKGAVILEVLPGSAAEKAGLKQNDLILSIAGKKIAGPQELSETIKAKKPNDKIDVQYLLHKMSSVFKHSNLSSNNSSKNGSKETMYSTSTNHRSHPTDYIQFMNIDRLHLYNELLNTYTKSKLKDKCKLVMNICTFLNDLEKVYNSLPKQIMFTKFF